MIVDDKLADLLISQFDEAWVSSTTLIDGGVLDEANMEALRSRWNTAAEKSSQ
jgi:hypothetical protein